MDFGKSERIIEPDTASAGFSQAEADALIVNRLGGTEWVYHEEADNLRKPFFLDFANFHDLETACFTRDPVVCRHWRDGVG